MTQRICSFRWISIGPELIGRLSFALLRPFCLFTTGRFILFTACTYIENKKKLKTIREVFYFNLYS